MMVSNIDDESNSNNTNNKPLKNNSSYPDIRSMTPTTMSLSTTSLSSSLSSSSGPVDQQEEELIQQQNSRKRKSNVLIDNDEISNSQDNKNNDDDNDDDFDVGVVGDIDAIVRSGLSGLTEHDVPRTVHSGIATITSSNNDNNMNSIVQLPYKGTTIRLPIELYLSCNDDIFSQYQCHVRKYIEFFETTANDLSISVQGRNRKIILGQVGIRCRYCYNTIINPNIIDNNKVVNHTPGSIYYPSKLLGIYQACQNMASLHLLNNCTNMTPDSRNTLKSLYENTILTKKPVVAGKDLWATTASAIGVYEDDEDQILRFDPCWSRKVLTG